ncbi:hypothetical protein LTR37_012725 [Vermiconidia calcicola]|uniref:Uncharacterized protein n=1 Tax=Vermiconidia calcicola TaxID=1690605 RepID=A0ACC3MYP6_9PEZI|nr:hypothetical protein LTR37_012725 [Vermiconidia calcicola]
MAGLHGQPPFSNYEKNYLLCEILKAASPSPVILLNVVNSLGIEPNWGEIALPPGRTVNQCAGVFQELRRTGPGAQPMSIVPGAIGPQTPSPMSAPLTLKRAFPFESTFSTGREIRPKPVPIGNTYGQPPAIEHPPKKKRGRPTKAEARAKAEAHGVSPEAGPAPRQQVVGGAVSGPPPPPPAPSSDPGLERVEQSPPGELRPSAPAVSRMPISSMLTPTGQKSDSQSSSSSGKRRRGRSTRSEPEGFPSTATSGAAHSQYQEYESPYARLTAATQDSPARTAVMRHRDERSLNVPPPQPSMTQTPASQPTSTSAPDPHTI